MLPSQLIASAGLRPLILHSYRIQIVCQLIEVLCRQ